MVAASRSPVVRELPGGFPNAVRQVGRRNGRLDIGYSSPERPYVESALAATMRVTGHTIHWAPKLGVSGQ